MPATLYFIDTEFNEDGKTIDLISIGIVARTPGLIDRELYLINQEARLDLVNPWVRKNVLPQLPRFGDPAWVQYAMIQNHVLDFVIDDGQPIEFWGYYSDYDWVVFCQLFGAMVNLPARFPKFCRDLKQLSVDRGSPKHPEQSNEHNAIDDARWNVVLYDFLMRKRA